MVWKNHIILFHIPYSIFYFPLLLFFTIFFSLINTINPQFPCGIIQYFCKYTRNNIPVISCISIQYLFISCLFQPSCFYTKIVVSKLLFGKNKNIEMGWYIFYFFNHQVLDLQWDWVLFNSETNVFCFCFFSFLALSVHCIESLRQQ